MDNDRREFLKKAVVGAAIATGVGGCPGEPATTDQVLPPGSSVDANLLRLSMARTDLPIEVWDDVLALHMLTKQVFDDPAVATTFARDPAAYLRSLRLDHVQLDMESVEVKLALAAGDPELRALIAASDFKGFVNALAERGLLGEAGRSKLSQRAAMALASSLGVPASTPGTDAFFAFAAAFLFVVVAITWVTVGYSVVAGVAVATQAALATRTAVSTETQYTSGSSARQIPLRAERRIFDHAPGLALAGVFGGYAAELEATKAFVAEVTESVARLLESSEVFMSRSKLDAAQLRSLVEKTLKLQLALPPA